MNKTGQHVVNTIYYIGNHIGNHLNNGVEYILKSTIYNKTKDVVIAGYDGVKTGIDTVVNTKCYKHATTSIGNGVKGGLGYLQDKTMQGYNASKDVIV